MLKDEVKPIRRVGSSINWKLAKSPEFDDEGAMELPTERRAFYDSKAALKSKGVGW